MASVSMMVRGTTIDQVSKELEPELQRAATERLPLFALIKRRTGLSQSDKRGLVQEAWDKKKVSLTFETWG